MGSVLLVDSSGMLASIDAGEREHRRVMRLLDKDDRPLVVTDFVLAEVDYLVLTRLGAKAERQLIQQLLDGVFVREPVLDRDLRRASEIAEQYDDHDLGLTDATLMAVSERLGSRQILTLDHRHFGLFRDRRGRPLELLPGDAHRGESKT